MATHGFLELPLRRRRRIVGEIDGYVTALRSDSGAAMATVLGAESDPVSVAVRAHLVRRMGVPVNLEPRFFGRRGTTAIVSLYFPPTGTIYLDFNRLAAGPRKLIDGLEHEVWHHLLPLADEAPASVNLWWEGFTEALSEIWGGILTESLPRAYQGHRCVAYPVQTAYVTLFLSCDRSASVAFAGGVLPASELAGRLRACNGPKTVLGSTLGRQIGEMLTMPPARQARVEKLLHDWRWREDDGGRISVGCMISEGAFEAGVIDREFRRNRRFLMDVIQALTVVNLQDVAARCRPLPRMPDMPRHLRENVLTVLDYVGDPYYQLSNR